MGGSNPSPPPTPDYAAADSAAVQQQLKDLPEQLKVQQAAELGINYTDPNTGKNFDFTGLGQAANLQQQLDLYQQSAPQIAQQQLDLNKEFDPQRIAQQVADIQQADPTAYKLHNAYNQQVLDNLNLGDQLSSDQLRMAQQTMRQAQTARGNVMGDNPSMQEAFGVLGYGQQLQQQRETNAAQALGLGGTNTQFGTIQGAQQGATSYSPITANLAGGVNFNAGQSGANFEAQTYGSQVQLYNDQLNAPNPWMQVAGMALGAGTKLGGAAMMSSEKAKENIEDFNMGYDVIKKLKVKSYDYKEGFGKKDCIGIIAEEATEPVRIRREDGFDMVDLYSLVGVLIDAVKTIQYKIENLERDCVYAK